jgi:hypothetical protein
LPFSELAKVFFEKVLYASWMTGSPVAIVIGIGAFFGVTFAVLMCMDVLECFLHALRLHWVEFQVSPATIMLLHIYTYIYMYILLHSFLKFLSILSTGLIFNCSIVTFSVIQNKFYFADGVSFMPFSYEAAMLEDADK